MSIRVVETSDPAGTEALGAELARELADGDVVLVRGELGSGKTTLVRGAARALGVADPVTSPTFSIGHRYRARTTIVSHLDLYRLADLEAEDPALLADHLGPGSIAFVEWPESAEAEILEPAFEVTLAHGGGDRRRIEVERGAGDRRRIEVERGAGDRRRIEVERGGGDRRRIEVERGAGGAAKGAEAARSAT